MPLTNKDKKPQITIVGSFRSKKDFGSNPEGYYIEINGIKVAEYGNDEVDNGYNKCEVFIEGYCVGKDISYPSNIKYEERNDYEDNYVDF